MSEFSINEKPDGDKSIFQINGTINEDSDFSKVLECQNDKIVIDFDGVHNINSCGVREWIQVIRQLNKKSEIMYENARKMVVMQFNQVKGFIADNCKVKNFYAPYYCDDCDKGSEQLIEAKEGLDEAPEVKCPDCGREMEFDALEDQYFLFLAKD